MEASGLEVYPWLAKAVKSITTYLDTHIVKLVQSLPRRGNLIAVGARGRILLDEPVDILERGPI